MKLKLILANIKLVALNTGWHFIIKIIETIVCALSKPLSLIVMQFLIDYSIKYYHGSTDIFYILICIILLVICMLLSTSIQSFDSLINEKMRIELNNRLSKNIISKVSLLEYFNFENKDIQDVFQRISDDPAGKIFDLFIYLTETVSGVITLIGLVMVFIQINHWIPLIFLVVLFTMMFLDYMAMNIMNTMFTNQTTDERFLNYYASIMGKKNSLMEIKLFNSISFVKDKLDRKIKNVLDERTRITVKAQKYSFFSSIFVLLWIGILILILIDSVKTSSITYGMFVSLIGSTENVLYYTEDLSFSFSKLSQNYFRAKYYFDFMNLPEEKLLPSKHRIILDRKCIVQFNNVSFTYPGSNDTILKNISFTFDSSESMAIVGENGSGKTTIVKLLCGLYKPTSGTITVNNINISDISYEERKQIFSVIFQDFVKYQLNIRDNVTLGDNEKAKYDSLNNILSNLRFDLDSYGLDQNIGKFYNDGVDLSGGQWQKLAIARSIYPDSKFVILDEPTAALDPIAENDLYMMFKDIITTRGFIIISHRLASAKLCSKILVLSDGKIIEEGSHDTLMSNEGYYSTMFKKQASWYQ